MSSVASGQLKKYEPLETKEFEPFNDYEELTIDNIKDACEHFYHALLNPCDMLVSGRSPPCTKFEQTKKEKSLLHTFLTTQKQEPTQR